MRAAPKAVEVAAVAVTKTYFAVHLWLRFIALSLLTQSLFAAVLPEERSDVMYHRYEGGGVEIDGPSVLIRKNFAETFSVSANYYVDKISSASIDVVTSGASEYQEERTEYSLTGDYLYDRSVFSAGITTSDENDYEANTVYFNVSQDMFGDLTTISLGYSRGNDTVRQTGNEEFEETIDRQNYRIGISQILTTHMLLAINYESITDEGFLNNPYRSYRYLNNPNDPSAGTQFSQEVYPATRTSDSIALRLAYHLPYRAAIKGEYRYFTDDWGIDAQTYQITYTHPFRDNWLFDIKYRAYQQGPADFYQDLFTTQSQDSKDYRARDKELSDFDSNTISIGISYQLPSLIEAVERSTISFQWDHIQFDYNNFRDLQNSTAATGEEPLYQFDADVFKLFFSIWY